MNSKELQAKGNHLYVAPEVTVVAFHMDRGFAFSTQNYNTNTWDQMTGFETNNYSDNTWDQQSSFSTQSYGENDWVD